MKTKTLCTAAAAAFTTLTVPNAQAYVLFSTSVDATGSNCAQMAEKGITQKQCDFMLATARARYEAATKVGISENECKAHFAKCVVAPQGGFRPEMEGGYVNLPAKYSGRIAAFFQYKPQRDLDTIAEHGAYPLVKMRSGEDYTLTQSTGWKDDSAIFLKPAAFNLKLNQ